MVPGSPRSLPGGSDAPARAGQRTPHPPEHEEALGSVHVEGWADPGPRLHFSCMVFRLTAFATRSRARAARLRRVGSSRTALTLRPPTGSSEGPSLQLDAPVRAACCSEGRCADVSTDPALCVQMDTQPRVQTDYQKHLSFLIDPTTGLEKEVS